MQIEIPDNLYQKLAQQHGDVTAFVQHTLRKAALDGTTEVTSPIDGDALIEEFEKLDNLFGEKGLDEVLSSRRTGLE